MVLDVLLRLTVDVLHTFLVATIFVMSHADVMTQHVRNGACCQMGFVNARVLANADGFGRADAIRYCHADFTAAKRLASVLACICLRIIKDNHITRLIN